MASTARPASVKIARVDLFGGSRGTVGGLTRDQILRGTIYSNPTRTGKSIDRAAFAVFRRVVDDLMIDLGEAHAVWLDTQIKAGEGSSRAARAQRSTKFLVRALDRGNPPQVGIWKKTRGGQGLQTDPTILDRGPARDYWRIQDVGEVAARVKSGDPRARAPGTSGGFVGRYLFKFGNAEGFMPKGLRSVQRFDPEDNRSRTRANPLTRDIDTGSVLGRGRGARKVPRLLFPEDRERLARPEKKTEVEMRAIRSEITRRLSFRARQIESDLETTRRKLTSPFNKPEDVERLKARATRRLNEIKALRAEAEAEFQSRTKSRPGLNISLRSANIVTVEKAIKGYQFTTVGVQAAIDKVLSPDGQTAAFRRFVAQARKDGVRVLGGGAEISASRLRGAD